MRVLIIWIILGCSTGKAIAQQDSITNDIRTTPRFSVGVFETFSDFKQNKPSITTGFKIRIDSGSAFVRYFLIDHKGKKIRNVYGFSDGQVLFINAQIYGQLNYFIPILMRGDILYFEDEIGKTNALAANSGAAYMFGMIGGMTSYLLSAPKAAGNPGWIIYFPDEDGYAYALSKRTMKSILKDDNPELLKQFENESGKNQYEVLIKYLNLHNQAVALKEN